MTSTISKSGAKKIVKASKISWSAFSKHEKPLPNLSIPYSAEESIIQSLFSVQLL